jgi:F420-dependent oxidoreductase-like protein
VIRLAADSLVVLAGPSGAGKSTWAAEWFRPSQVVSSDGLRSVVGQHANDLRASTDAFAVLDLVVERRLARGLFTVIDTLGMEPERHQAWLGMAARHRRPTHLVLFDDDDKVYRKRNRARPGPVPPKVLTAQLARWAELKDGLGGGFDHVHRGAGPAAIVPGALLGASPAAADAAPVRLEFGLQVSSFDWPGRSGGAGGEALADGLARIVGEAERAGFTSLWVMDHFIQIPQVGPVWDPMLEAYTTLGFLAGRSNRLRLGAMVTCVTHRNLAHLAKIVATLDVLSGGRAWCGLGTGWYQREHDAYGYRFPPVAERYDLLEDALELLPLMWGPGSPAFDGRRISVREAICYPRPVQPRIPVLIGGSGERRTLKLVARHADACNLFGEPDVIRRKLDVLDRHCLDAGRDRSEIEITQLSPLLSAPDQSSLAERIDELKPGAMPPEEFARLSLAGTTGQHIERFARLAGAGVQTAIVALADAGHPGAVSAFAPVIDAFRP